MSEKTIVLDALLVGQRPTGVGRSILELTRALAAGKRGFSFKVLATSADLFSFLDSAPEWEVVPCRGATGGSLIKAIYTQFWMPRICRSLAADLLHSLQFVAPRFLPCPSVVTVHDLAWQLFPETVEEPRRTYYRVLVPSSLNRADAIVTNSQATAQDVRHLYPQVKDIHVTAFGTPTWAQNSPWNNQDSPPDNNSCTNPFLDRPFFLFVGTLEPRKNLDRLVQAYASLLEMPGPWPGLLLVGGKGWRDSSLRRSIEPLKKAGDLKVLDYCDIDLLAELYGQACALLFPSRHEGFGFPILEAMAFGLPVMTSGVGAMAEVSGTAAFHVDPLDTESLTRGMARLATDGALRERLIHEGRAWARGWNWEKTAEATMAVYRKLLVGHGHREECGG